jgi:four helix bundle protein
VASYRELIVWQKALRLVPLVYALAARLPREERYALSDQLRRAAISVPANIAEGQARQHRREFAQALSIARGSLAELDTLITVAISLGYVSEADVQPAREMALSVRQLLHRLIQRMREDSRRQ